MINSQSEKLRSLSVLIMYCFILTLTGPSIMLIYMANANGYKIENYSKGVQWLLAYNAVVTVIYCYLIKITALMVKFKRISVEKLASKRIRILATMLAVIIFPQFVYGCFMQLNWL